MTEMEFINMTVGLLKEILQDVPDEYIVRFEDCGFSYPVMDYDIEPDVKEFNLKTV